MREFIFVLFMMVIIAAQAGNDKKYSRIMARANAHYEEYSYQRAIILYKKALEIKQDQEPTVQVAKSYFAINDMKYAKIWYEKALQFGALADDQMIDYAQALSTLQLYDSAARILEKYHHVEDWVSNRSKGFKNIEQFYRDTLAFEISEWPFNTEYKDFSATILQNKKVVFVSNRPYPGVFKSKYKADYSFFLNLYEVNLNAKSEDEMVKIMHKKLNTRYHEGPSQFYMNDKRVMFTRNNYNNRRSSKSEDGANLLKIFLSERKEEGVWSSPREFKYNSDEYSVGHPTVTDDAETLYFASDMPGGFGGVDIYQCQLVNGEWSVLQNLGALVNTAGDEMFPYISQDGMLYFSSNGHEGLGGLDIFRVNIGQSNADPVNIGAPLNSSKDDFGISLENNVGYFSSNRDGGTGDDDIYALSIFEFIVKINLRDSKTNELISGRIEAVSVESDFTASIDSSSNLEFRAFFGSKFTIFAKSTGYFADSLLIELNTKAIPLDTIEFDVFLTKPAKKPATVYLVHINDSSQQVLYVRKDEHETKLHEGSFSDLKRSFIQDEITIDSVIYLRNILYDFDEFNIREDARVSLGQWMDYLNEYPDDKISLSAHTDLRGSNQYNVQLAKNRVNSALEYLVKNGISKDRIIKKSFGESELWEKCSEMDCTEIQHQNNRRTEILVVKSTN